MKAFIVEAVDDKEQFIVVVNDEAPKDWYKTDESICETAEEHANRQCRVIGHFVPVLDYQEYAVFIKK